ncbi:MAG: M23 family metallopeptidase [Clostridia bacterium]|nr:M23 family metallopeptidase [Clostridia bacterium]
MKFLKRYTLVLFTGAVLFALAAAGFAVEKNRILSEAPKETSYRPEAIYVPKPAKTVLHEDESLTPPEEKTEQTAQTAAKDTTAEAAEEAANIPLVFSEPIAAGVSEGYSNNELVYSETMKDYRTHSGLDYKADSGTPVFATAYGTVSSIEKDGSYGLAVTIDHGGGLESVYASLGECCVSVGDTVERGDTIATVGDSASVESAEGSHLHFEVKRDGQTVNPVELIG